MEKEILTVKDISRILEISEEEAKNLIKKLHHKKIAGKYFTTIDMLKKWISYSFLPYIMYSFNDTLVVILPEFV